MRREPLFVILAAVLLVGCGSASAADRPTPSGTGLSDSETHTWTASGLDTPDNENESVEFNGVVKLKKELSEDTLKWLEWYYTLSEDSRNALSFVPAEFIRSGTGHTMETEYETFPAYSAALTEAELLETEELAYYYFTEDSADFEGIEEICLAKDDNPHYHNIGIEAEYDPGNIIIYMVLTGKDKAAGNPMRSISIARKSKSDSWKIINSGF